MVVPDARLLVWCCKTRQYFSCRAVRLLPRDAEARSPVIVQCSLSEVVCMCTVNYKCPLPSPCTCRRGHAAISGYDWGMCMHACVHWVLVLEFAVPAQDISRVQNQA
jgi:hypothetical protein